MRYCSNCTSVLYILLYYYSENNDVIFCMQLLYIALYCGVKINITFRCQSEAAFIGYKYVYYYRGF